MTSDNVAPEGAKAAVLVPSEAIPEDAKQVKGLEFDQYADRDITAAELVENMATMGFQASAVAEAARVINDMVTGITAPHIN